MPRMQSLSETKEPSEAACGQIGDSGGANVDGTGIQYRFSDEVAERNDRKIRHDHECPRQMEQTGVCHTMQSDVDGTTVRTTVLRRDLRPHGAWTTEFYADGQRSTVCGGFLPGIFQNMRCTPAFYDWLP